MVVYGIVSKWINILSLFSRLGSHSSSFLTIFRHGCPNRGVKCRWLMAMQKLWFSTKVTLYLRNYTKKGEATVTIECEWDLICNLLNDLEWPLTHISRSNLQTNLHLTLIQISHSSVNMTQTQRTFLLNVKFIWFMRYRQRWQYIMEPLRENPIKLQRNAHSAKYTYFFYQRRVHDS